jgi:uncharacterized protein (DUF427 family)
LSAESVWDYPRPPAVVPCERHVRVELADLVIADSRAALRVLETSHPPTIYLPPADVLCELLVESAARATFCEFKGNATYYDLVVDDKRCPAVCWSYLDPAPGYEALRNYFSFFPARVDAAWLDDERVQPQESAFYGGWITSDVVGPFKGAVGTTHW